MALVAIGVAGGVGMDCGVGGDGDVGGVVGMVEQDSGQLVQRAQRIGCVAREAAPAYPCGIRRTHLQTTATPRSVIVPVMRRRRRTMLDHNAYNRKDKWNERENWIVFQKGPTP